MATFSLTTLQTAGNGDRTSQADGLGSSVLVHNIRWFIGVRWFVVCVLILAGLVSCFAPAIVTQIGLIPPHSWPLLLAAVLATVNLLFWALSRHLTAASPDRFVRGNLWSQIVADLLVLTVMVHFVGSTTTFVSFIYLFHVVLACIFFSSAESLAVTLLAGGLYLFCVGAEILGIWPATGLVPTGACYVFNRTLPALYAVSAVLIWLTVWYLVATLSRIVRERDRLLESANRQLLAADQEKNRIVLRTTHDLKAPFSGMESNIQALRLKYWDQIPDSVKDIVQRIEARAATLSDRIRDILLLGDLRTQNETAPAEESVDIGSVLQKVMDELEDKAQKQHIAVHMNPMHLKARGDPRHFFILFSNLVANAISYSPEGGTVEISARRDEEDVHVLVENHGIGIPSEALPKIFDEYFRTKEAATYNPGSTGLGLSIVKEIVQKEKLKIFITSEVGRGTMFDVAIPAERCEFD